ncbi:6-pyruvoyl trahydropterin synthase family protein [Sulfurisphaera ohwakuensis]|uniref:6-pyruvoyl tetrahydrobiopterin synthase n=1 Tax=Sulfurisphaera ohwakuensis TaxID=69656 RepID=A0A650CED6_SULOH|nr:6-pyruvoyl tetrahydropterin synthase family protein [Sulfurisphaera ohwakuensis]MBB5252867.1 6-pyruvoyltetrahydropterin/6-carboxytetrahydropterin synthase [Sulfurisphaera ohwakuensis]QGR16200.1 6-pyruvoyl tetrahydrobiopterin synthase [Sulfurisphaera ohwakuensis]
MKVKVGLEGFSFDSAHYTLSSEGNQQIHGHTYRVSIEVEGESIDENTGFVIDFDILKKIINDIVKDWDHKLIIPSEDLNQIYFKGPFKLDIKVIPYKYPTAEYIGLEIAKSIYEKLQKKYKITVKIYEGENNYAIIEYP